MLHDVSQILFSARGSTLPQAEAEQSPESLRHAAEAFEKAFLTEMLRHAGVGAMPEGFNGGPGEEAFSDFLIREYAGEISRSGKLGLSERIFESLSQAAAK